MMPPPPKREQREDEQQDGEGEPGLAPLLDLGEAALARVAAPSARRRRPRPGAARSSAAARSWSWRSRSAMLTHSVEIDWKGWRACAQEGGELAIGDREGERRVAVLVAGDQRVDAEHPAALVEQRPAEWPRAILAVWSRVVMPLIGRTLEKMPTERVGGSGVI